MTPLLRRARLACSVVLALVLAFGTSSEAQRPVSDFFGTPTSGYAPLNATFIDISSGLVTAWAWDFGDGGTSTIQNPNYSFATPGTYTVSLTVTNPAGSDTETKVDYITTLIPPPPPVASFTATPPTIGGAPLTVAFTDTSTGVVTAYNWDYGDSASSTAQHPSHTYHAHGTYSVSLTVIGPGGSDTATMTDLVTVNAQSFGASLDTLQMVPAGVSPGIGTASFAFDATTGMVTVTGSYSGLLTDQVNVTVRRGAFGVTGPQQYTLSGTGGTSGTISGSATLTAQQIADMTAGNHYIQIHTSGEPFGEIRGQICNLAHVKERNAGTNPDSYTASAPVMGGTFNATVDLSTTGHNLAVLVGYQTPFTLTLGNGSTLLVNIADTGGELFSFGAQAGPLAAFTSPVPTDVSVCNFMVFSQAVHIGGVIPFRLSNAQDLVIGH